jgi:thymidylate synthase
MAIVIKSDNITRLYNYALWWLGRVGISIGNTIEIENFVFELSDPRSRFIIDPFRKHSLKYMKKEILWYLTGDYSIKDIGEFASTWKRVSDDGEHVNSNYGAKLFHDFFANKIQFQYVIDELKRDPTSRRAIVFFNLPHKEYHQMHTTKDFPCTVYAQFLLRNDVLNMNVHMRSNDLIYGWCNDVPFFTILQEMVAAKLGVDVGTYTHCSGSLHVYERHFSLITTADVDRIFSDEELERMRVFPRIYEEDINKIINLQPCEFVDFLRSENNEKPNA